MAGAKLQDMKIQKAKPMEKPYKLSDGGGLHLYITPAGGKYWRWQFRFNGKQRMMSLGDYSHVSLTHARLMHQEYQAILHAGKNPITVQKEARYAAGERRIVPPLKPLIGDAPKLHEDYPDGSFGALARAWYAHWKPESKPKPEGTRAKITYADQMNNRLEADILPALGKRPVNEIEPFEVVGMVEKVDQRGAHEMARFVHRVTNRIFRWGIAKKYVKQNPASAVRPSDILKPIVVKHHARVGERDLPALLLAMENDTGTEITRLGMWTMARTFVRTTELVEAPWVV
jgi:hypothetical protein